VPGAMREMERSLSGGWLVRVLGHEGAGWLVGKGIYWLDAYSHLRGR
jgi:hypothetical protein